jgi:hypothetical protein
MAIVALIMVVVIAMAVSMVIDRKVGGNPAASVTLWSYTDIHNPPAATYGGDWLRANIVVTDIGGNNIAYEVNPATESPNSVLKIETAGGWETNVQRGKPLYTQVTGPGESRFFPVWLPTNTLRWEFSFNIRGASRRESWEYGVTKLGLKIRLFKVAIWPARFLSEQEGPEVMIQSPVFEVATNVIPLR